MIQDEKGADIVADAINGAYDGKTALRMNKMNFFEVYYYLYRKLGKEKADMMASELKKHPIFINSEISDAILSEAVRMKVNYKMSVADSFAVAETLVFGGELMTADHHELDAVEGKEKIRFCWIR